MIVKNPVGNLKYFTSFSSLPLYVFKEEHFPHGIFGLETIKNSIGQMEQGIHANKSTLLSIKGKSKI